MPKLKGIQPASDPQIPKLSYLSGPWGRVNPTPGAVLTLRVCKSPSAHLEECYSYPYRTLSTWTWRKAGSKEELKIEAGPDIITAIGTGLVRLVEALDNGTLEQIVESTARRGDSLNEPIIVESLIVEKLTQSLGLAVRLGSDGGRVRAE